MKHVALTHMVGAGAEGAPRFRGAGWHTVSYTETDGGMTHNAAEPPRAVQYIGSENNRRPGAPPGPLDAQDGRRQVTTNYRRVIGGTLPCDANGSGTHYRSAARVLKGNQRR